MENQIKMLKPQFYITRANGDLVPLIAMDELPGNIIINNAPRTLSHTSTSGMKCVGEYPRCQMKYSLIITNDWIADNETGSSNSQKQEEQFVPRAPPSHQKKSHCDKNVPKLSQDNFKNVEPTMIPGKKQYCSYWLRTGECEFAQQGCLYIHDMPHDLATLNLLGLRDIPKWYRVEHGVGSFLASTGAGAAFKKPWSKSLVSNVADASASHDTDSHHTTRPSNGTDQPQTDNNPAPKKDKQQSKAADSQNQKANGGVATQQNSKQQKQPEATEYNSVATQTAPPQTVNLLDDDTIIVLTENGANTSTHGASSGTAKEQEPTGGQPSTSRFGDCIDIEHIYVREDAERRAKEAAEYAAQLRKLAEDSKK